MNTNKLKEMKEEIISIYLNDGSCPLNASDLKAFQSNKSIVEDRNKRIYARVNSMPDEEIIEEYNSLKERGLL